MIEKNRIEYPALILAAIAVLLTVAGCNGQGSPPPKTLTSLQITPTNQAITVGGTQQLKAAGTFSDGSTADLTASVTWKSSDTSLATIDSAGLAKAIAVGRPQITATSGTVSNSTRLIVVGSSFPVALFAYVADLADNTVSTYTVNPATGQLRANGYILAGKQPNALAVEPRGNFVYVANFMDNNVSGFSIDPLPGRFLLLPALRSQLGQVRVLLLWILPAHSHT
jgi:DNA-binding beta-propeller fold protein YncE